MKQLAIIVDLDGTLCNTSHRQHYMEGPKKNWPAFYEALAHDEVNHWCFQLIRMMRAEYATLFVSGRPDSYREVTQEWLNNKNFQGWPLFMRKENDFRKDSVVKEEIFWKEIEPKYEVLFCVDDRQQVVDMWRSLGLTCLQCAKGDF